MNAYEKITIAQGDVAYLGYKDNYGDAGYASAMIRVRQGVLSFRVDGTDPTEDDGAYAKAGDTIILHRANQIRYFAAYGVSSEEVILDVEYRGEDIVVYPGAGATDDEGRIILAGYDYSQNALAVIEVAPAELETWEQNEDDPLLNAVATTSTSGWVSMENVKNAFFVFDVDILAAAVTLYIEACINEDTPVEIESIAVSSDDVVHRDYSGKAWKKIRTRVEMAADNDAVVTSTVRMNR